jgi:phosphoglycolate phosphatase
VNRAPVEGLVCFDLLGTTVVDESAAERAMSEAVATQGIVPGTSAYTRVMVQVHRVWGRADVFGALFPEDQARAWAVSEAFDHAFASQIRRSRLTEAPGAEAVFTRLRSAGRAVGFVTSLPPSSLDGVLDALRWRPYAEVVVSGPQCRDVSPVAQAARRVGISDTATVAVVGDTEALMEQGVRYGVGAAIGVSTGLHPPKRLREAGATHIVESVAQVPAILLGHDS